MSYIKSTRSIFSGEIANKLFAISMILVSVFTGLMGTTASTLLLKLYRVGLGIAEGPIAVGCLNIINRWFPLPEKGTANGLGIASTKIGPLLVPPICVFVVEMFG